MGIFSSKQKTKSTNDPSAMVQPFLQNSVSNYGNLNTPQSYQGDWQADMNPMLSGAYGNMYDNQYGQNALDQGAQAGQMGMDAMGSLNEGFQYDQGVYDQTMDNLMPGIQGSYDAATRDGNNNLNWNTLPGLNMGLSTSGQQGSSKGGQQTALAQGMAMNRNADIGASMYQNAMGSANANAMNAGGQNLNAFGQVAGMGLNQMNQGFGQNQDMLNNQLIAGQGQQAYDQMGNDMDRQQWNEDEMNPWEFEAQRLGNLTNTGNTFGTQRSTNSSNPGIGNIALQAGMAYATGGGSLLAGGGNPFSSGGGGNPFSAAGVNAGIQNNQYGSGPNQGLIPDYNWG
jgi:hypothetical protein